MLCINDHHTDPYFNLAAEEYVLKHFHDDCFMLWRNEPSVIVGRHQNSLAEINIDFIRQNRIKVVRRLSGGGAVFHDLGNLNFTFIETTQDNKQIDFRKYTRPVIAVLQQSGIDARFEGRNDLLIDGKKFSGNAEHVFRNRVLHHGTLLFASELTDLSGALNANPAKFRDKAIKSVRSRVTNISSHLKEPIDLDTFRKLILDYIMSHYAGSTLYEYSERDLASIHELRNRKYATWEWNFGQSPGYNMVKGVQTGGGFLEVHTDVRNGMIEHIRIYGDFFNIEDVASLENMLTGIPHNEERVREKLGQIQLSAYLVNITIEELLSVMF